jgi:hypothetical protein
MESQLKILVEKTSTKHLGHAIKRDVKLQAWIMKETDLWPHLNLTQRVRCILHKDNPICDVSSQPKLWKSMQEGFGFCGRAWECDCARQSVSASVSATKKTVSDSEQQVTNQKRAQTNLEKYGVTNTGQTYHARKAHEEVYADAQKVRLIVDQIQQTNMHKYGVKNPMQVESVKHKAQQTNMHKYGSVNAMSNPVIAAQSVKTRKENYEPHHLARQNYPRFCTMIIENFGVKVLIPESEYIGVQTRPSMAFECIKCATQFEKRFDYASPPICRVCNPTEIIYKSNEEMELLDYIKSIYTGHIISGDRRLINPYEIDILLPELNLAFEYCGLYWHSELSGHKTWNYHYRKFKAAQDKHVRLITLFSDEWLNRKDLVKQYIKVLLHKQSQSVYARKCVFNQISHDTARDYLKDHHIIGAPQRVSWAGGLYHNNELCAVMTFRNTEGTSYELNRFATHGHVVGAASRLLKRFIQNNLVTHIVSFSDNRFSEGNLYKQLGFVHDGDVPPMQSYVKDYSMRYHKLALGKQKLLESYPTINTNQTEWQILQSLGYDRIWDCGKIKWKIIL